MAQGKAGTTLRAEHGDLPSLMWRTGFSVAEVAARFGTTYHRAKAACAPADRPFNYACSAGAPWKIPQSWHDEHHRNRRDLQQERRDMRQLLAELPTARPCRACERPVVWRPSDCVTCSPLCTEIWRELRFVIDPEEHKKHSLLVWAWYARNPEHSTSTPERMAAVLDGAPTQDRGRWFIAGSRKLQLAALAVRRGYRPVIDGLSEKQRYQVAAYLAEQVAA